MREAATQNGTDPGDLDELVPEPLSYFTTEELSLWSPLLLRPTLSLMLSWMFMSFIYYGKHFAVIFSAIRLLHNLYSSQGSTLPSRSWNFFPAPLSGALVW